MGSTPEVRQLTGVVTDVSSSLIGVNVNGGILRIPCVGTYIPAVGDVVTVDVVNGRGRVSGPVIRGQRPSTGTVTVGASGGYVTVTAASVAYLCRYAGTAPSVGQVVFLDWQATEPRIISSSTPSSAPPPVNPPSGPSAPPPLTTGTLYVTATASWGRSSSAGWATNYPRQGSSGGVAWTGAWFYGTKPSQIRGRTVTAFAFRVPVTTAYDSSGNRVSVTVNLYRHTSNTRPSGDVSRVAGPTGVTGSASARWVTLPTAWGQSIVDSGGGIGISGGSYAVLTGISGDAASGQLVIAWRT